MTTGEIVRPHDLYQLDAQHTSSNLNDIYLEQYLNGCYYEHMPEIPGPYESVTFRETANDLKVVVHKHFDFDYRRFWRLASVWIGDEPFMIIQNAGREGDDFRKRFITAPNYYWDAVNYINAVAQIPPKDLEDVVDPLAALGTDLTHFYGNSLNGYFERY